MEPREECYAKIRACMKEGIGDYYRRFPERLMDERSKNAIDYSVRGLDCVLAILDEYEIASRATDVK